ncbi:YpmS family protein [Leuconostoc suionicum]|uniref:YpmS family protein n=1 Tax=Leuconostoc suionicum TaxID=1511761 RepID=UPI004035E426
MADQTIARSKKIVKKKKPIWFWLFWGLIFILLVGGIWLFNDATGPVKIKDNVSKISKSDATFDVSLNKKQINALVAHYLNDTDNSGYTFKIGDDVMMYGSAKLLGQKFNFGMALDAKLTPNGNIVMQAKSLAIGNLSLPIKTVMSYVRSSYDAPEYVTIVPKEKQIFIDMSKLPTTQGIKFKAKVINIKADQFVFQGGLANEKK